MLQLARFLPSLFLLLAICLYTSLASASGERRISISLENGQKLEFSKDSLKALGLLTKSLSAKDSSKNKWIAAVLAIPPLGMFGLHRIYLGAKPIIPILYIATLGGFLGILPFTDTMVLLLSRDAKPFAKNSKILMWHKENK